MLAHLSFPVYCIFDTFDVCYITDYEGATRSFAEQLVNTTYHSVLPLQIPQLQSDLVAVDLQDFDGEVTGYCSSIFIIEFIGNKAIYNLCFSRVRIAQNEKFNHFLLL